MPDLHVSFTATARMPIERRTRPAGCRDILPRAGLVSCLACSIVSAVRRAAEIGDGSNPALGPRQRDHGLLSHLISRWLVSGCGPYLARHCRPAAASIEQRCAHLTQRLGRCGRLWRRLSSTMGATDRQVSTRVPVLPVYSLDLNRAPQEWATSCSLFQRREA